MQVYQDRQSQLLEWEAEKFVRGVEMTEAADGYTIQFPDECRESLYWSRAKTMLVYPTRQRKVKYRGWVVNVTRNSVSLDFSFKSSPHRYIGRTQFDVKFTDNSWNVTNQREAVRNAGRLRNVLIPSRPINSALQNKVPTLSLFNKQLETDPEQRQAVQHIVAGTSKPAAYIVFGPPGTGTAARIQHALI